MTITDGKHSLDAYCHERVVALMKSGVLAKNAVVQLSDWSASYPADFFVSDVDVLYYSKKTMPDLSSIQQLNPDLRLDAAREILARNIIADFAWRCKEQRKERTRRDKEQRNERRRRARRIIENSLLRFVAKKRHQELVTSAVSVQKVLRGRLARRIHFDRVQQRLEEFRRFNSIWKQAICRVPKSEQSNSGWSLIREQIDLKKVELLDDDGNFAKTDERLNTALSGALQENRDSEEEGEGEGEEEVEEADGGDDIKAHPNTVEDGDVATTIDWSKFQVSTHVVKFIKNGDHMFRDIFVRRMKQLAKGERSHKLQKPLKGCESIICESFLSH